jgi:hypothetical protein
MLLIHECTGEDLWPERPRVELKRRNDSEVSSAAADAPEQVGVPICRSPDEPAVGGHDVGGDEVID